jgi:hypothetical protein
MFSLLDLTMDFHDPHQPFVTVTYSSAKKLFWKAT